MHNSVTERKIFSTKFRQYNRPSGATIVCRKIDIRNFKTVFQIWTLMRVK